MKKLIIALAVVAMAVCSQAASYKWKCANLTDYAGASFSGTVALVNSIMGDSTSVSGGSSSFRLITSDDFEVGTYYGFYVTYTDAQGNVFKSVTRTMKAQVGSTPQMTFSMAGGTWQTVPEPTSAMLLLLGVAGLALKRKQK